MHHTLVTFLGRGQSKPDLGYPSATYDFPDRKRTTTFFGLALAEYLNPDLITHEPHLLARSGRKWGQSEFFAPQRRRHAARGQCEKLTLTPFSPGEPCG